MKLVLDFLEYEGQCLRGQRKEWHEKRINFVPIMHRPLPWESGLCRGHTGKYHNQKPSSDEANQSAASHVLTCSLDRAMQQHYSEISWPAAAAHRNDPACIRLSF